MSRVCPLWGWAVLSAFHHLLWRQMRQLPFSCCCFMHLIMSLSKRISCHYVEGGSKRGSSKASSQLGQKHWAAPVLYIIYFFFFYQETKKQSLKIPMSKRITVKYLMQELLCYLTVCCLVFLTLEGGHYVVWGKTALFFPSAVQEISGKLTPWTLYLYC